MEKNLSGVKIKVVQGDITNSEVDAIVNAANNHLWMGAGVAGAIKKRGGKGIEDEAMRKGPIPIGEAIVTSAGKLKAKYVIHAAVMGQDLVTNEEYIKNATQNSLKRVGELEIESIAFPAFGTGVGGFPTDRCARIMLDEVKDFSKRIKCLKKVLFVLFDKKSYDIWSIKL
ncbi:Appr-1-p processing protein [candidate division WOR-1 bacterium DG_54_3]|uniref:Appr-1-p processing protein n=1 Tax=candidate division WOR-1 bacterium DG_54_3 TaxID=1703775 RepID=A0A0S7XK35_UNCSA|nr:MAG: Appr-1-p processing protein [candidate division WOR-1 bacterium DG_54_3]